MPQLPGTDLAVSDLCLDGNVFGWTADQPASYAVLDRFADAMDPQSAFVDTAEMYGAGRSEEIVGGWLADHGRRDRVVLATKASPMDKEHPLAAGEVVAAEQQLGVLPYYGLARGFLTGKYRAGERVGSPRAERASAYVGERGDRVLAALGEVARQHGTTTAAVALRWLADRPTVVAPIASARSVEQLADLLPMRHLRLSDEQTEHLDAASA